MYFEGRNFSLLVIILYIVGILKHWSVELNGDTNCSNLKTGAFHFLSSLRVAGKTKKPTIAIKKTKRCYVTWTGCTPQAAT